MNPISRIEEEIKSLKIQGATNVALKVLEGLSLAVNILKVRKDLDPHVYLLEQTIRLAFTRPTEPLSQNAVRFIFQKKENSPQTYLKLADEYKKIISESKNKVAKFGIDLIKDGGIYLTHCHSSTVTNMFVKAYKLDKKFSVLTTETRPNFQGRITANELISAGISDITMIIDDVAPAIILENKMKIK